MRDAMQEKIKVDYPFCCRWSITILLSIVIEASTALSILMALAQISGREQNGKG